MTETPHSGESAESPKWGAEQTLTTQTTTGEHVIEEYADERRAIGIIGAGRAGTALAVALHHAGRRVVAVASRTAASADRLADRVGARACREPAAVVDEADVLLLTVPDDAIRTVAGALAATAAEVTDRCILHASGSHSGASLAPLADRGAATGSLHPLQSLADLEDGWRRLAGCYCAVEGAPRAVATARALVEAIAALPFEVPTEGKVLYHAAAATASNYFCAVEAAALDMMLAAGIDGDQALAVLRPLVEGTCANIFAHGPARALTGPVRRGDVAVIGEHLAAIGDRLPGLEPLYRHLAQQALILAQRGGSPSPEAAMRLRQLLATDCDRCVVADDT